MIHEKLKSVHFTKQFMDVKNIKMSYRQIWHTWRPYCKVDFFLTLSNCSHFLVPLHDGIKEVLHLARNKIHPYLAKLSLKS